MPSMDRTIQATRFGYNPALDGLRAIAVAGVISAHAGVRGVAGYHGVTVFFVISGFLITGLLLAEHARTARIDFRHFYRRRFARLGPALILVVAVSVLWLIAVRQALSSYWAGVCGALTYTMDLVQALDGNGHVSRYFQWSWSLSIEEQFYLAWPLLLTLFLLRHRFRLMVGALLAVVIAVWVVRVGQARLHATHELIFFGPFSHIDSLVLGVLLALLLSRPALVGALTRVGRWSGPVGVVGLAGLAVRGAGIPRLDVLDPNGFGQTALCAAAVVLWTATAPTGWFGRLLSLRPLVLLGKLSYGLYLWNLLTIAVFVEAVGVRPAQSWFGWVWLAALLGTCFLSWRFVETPLRRRWAPPRAHAVIPLAAPQA